MASDLESSINDINAFGESLLTTSLDKFANLSSTSSALPHKPTLSMYNTKGHKGCPMNFDFQNDPLSTTFTPYYEINMFYHSYDFIFDRLNYKTEEQFKSSKTIRNYPRHLRKTLFLNSNEKIKQLRKKDFGSIFVIAENLKDKANTLYKNEQYHEALNHYTIIYSFYKWLAFTSKTKEKKILSNLSQISDDPIIDSDVVIKTCKLNTQMLYEKENYNNSITFILKAMCYCYIYLHAYNEAIKCIDEAFQYCGDKLPDLYFRRAQARMFNKSSSIDELNLALNDMKQAMKRASKEEVIQRHYEMLIQMIKEKNEKDKEKFLKLIHNVTYAIGVIRKKQINIESKLSKSYEMNELNYKILNE